MKDQPEGGHDQAVGVEQHQEQHQERHQEDQPEGGHDPAVGVEQASRHAFGSKAGDGRAFKKNMC